MIDFMKMSELRGKNKEELNVLLKSELMSLSQMGSNIFLGKEKNTSLVRKKSVSIARLQTVIREIEIVGSHE